MRVLVVGGGGTLGRAVGSVLTASGHDVVALSRRSSPAIDLADVASIGPALDAVGRVDAMVSCAASAPTIPLSDETFLDSLHPKLLGQVALARAAVPRLDGPGSITLTSGAIPAGLPDAAGGALVNAGLDAFVAAAAPGLPPRIRLNAVSPGWLRETLESLGLDPSDGTPAAVVAEAYRDAVEGSATGQVLRVGSG